jgi:hypothetical protein
VGGQHDDPAVGETTPPTQSGPVEISSTFFSNDGSRSARSHLSLALSHRPTYRPKQRTSLAVDDSDDSDGSDGSDVPIAPAGWNTDPTGRHHVRYWDGFHWTDHVADAGDQTTDPAASRSTAPSRPLSLSTGPVGPTD